MWGSHMQIRHDGDSHSVMLHMPMVQGNGLPDDSQAGRLPPESPKAQEEDRTRGDRQSEKDLSRRKPYEQEVALEGNGTLKAVK